MTATNLGLGGNPVRFQGAYLINLSCQLGLAQGPSTCSITLIDDVPDGVIYNESEVGTYHTINVGSKFSFSGVMMSWSRDVRNISGRQITVNLSDPREIMSAIPMIMAPGFRNVVDGITSEECSVLDVYGSYDDFETTGANLSGWNQAGIPYERVDLALRGGSVTVLNRKIDIPELVANVYGERYRFDLSELTAKVSDISIRMNNNLISIADFIQEVAEKNSLDWYVTSSKDAQGYIDVVIRVIDRRVDNVDIALDDFLAANSGSVVSATRGFELRNDVACSALLGAPVEQMRSLNIQGLANNPVDLSDEGGSSKYFMTEEEMRYVIGNKQAWLLWVDLNGGIARYALGGVSQILATPMVQAGGFSDVENQIGIHGDRPRPGTALDQETRIGQIYEKLKGHASSSYGKRFLFSVPTDTDVIDAAWTLDAVGGDDDPNEYFRKEDGKTRCYVEFTTPTNLAITAPRAGFVVGKGEQAAQPLTLELAGNYTNEKAVVDLDKGDWIRSDRNVNGISNLIGNKIFVAATIEEGGIVRIDAPVIQANPDKREVQDVIEETRLKNFITDADGVKTHKGRRATLRLIHLFGERGAWGTIHAKAFQPSFVHVPVRSKFNRYGPVFSSSVGPGIQGQLTIDQDDGFSPWEFGSQSVMLQAMQFKVDNESSVIKTVENANVTIENFPEFSIGEALGFNSNINSINIGMQGQVTTSYELRSFLRKFGELTKVELAQLSLLARRGTKNSPQDNLAFINRYRSKISKQFGGRGNRSTSGLSGGANSFE